VARIRFRRSRLRATSSDPGARSGIGLLANAGTYAAGDSRFILRCPFRKFDPAWDSRRKAESSHDWDRCWRSWHSLAMFIVDLFKSRRRLSAENLFLRQQLSIAWRRGFWAFTSGNSRCRKQGGQSSLGRIRFQAVNAVSVFFKPYEFEDHSIKCIFVCGLTRAATCPAAERRDEVAPLIRSPSRHAIGALVKSTRSRTHKSRPPA
jgi:hypothetical protein